ncbi:GlsB/YeaQ/YmgE family stress response membrane protein, partial [Marinobacter nauticus]|uniref:GlsB/YeaQ/YmgE family stress response membrane protein n=1 Tax=Marinobacter nauticus TaxID=2743 RepID=UPI000F1311BE
HQMESEVTTAIIGVLGAFIGGLFGFLGAHLSTKTQLRIAQSTNDHQLRLEADKAARALKEKELLRLRGQIERAHKICSKIALENSQTVSYLESTGKLDIDAFHRRYLENCEKLDELRAIAAIDIPELIKVADEIYGLANVFWGNQSWKMEHLKNENQGGADAVSQQLYEAIFAMPGKIKEAKSILRDRAEVLNKALNPT